MQRCRPRRDPQRGNSLLLALIVMSSLATLGSLTVVSVQSSLKSSTNERAQAIALYAAESGIAMGMAFLRQEFKPDVGWSALVTPSNVSIQVLGAPVFPASGALPGTPNNPFSPDQNAWFSIQVLNNRSDPGFDKTGNNDEDGQVILRATGNGPQGSVAILEWELRRVKFDPDVLSPPPPPWDPVVLGGPLVLVGWHIVL
jgi:Tfp pilus assembly protein PilX